jgi:3-hydroxyisobutyrate dehydrogenase-like beta-hydroxyacid dehydrogenase
MKMAFLGLGKMGTAIASLLLQNGHQLTVWNRTTIATKTLVEAGAQAAGTPAEAVAGVPVVFTMLSDDAALTSVVFGPDGILNAMDADAIHVSLSTISVKLSRELSRAHHQRFVAAPVFGRPHIAEQGKLWIALAGAKPSVERALPLLDAISRGRTIVSEEPWRANALKLAGNFMISAMIQTLSEAFVFAAAQGIDPDVFIETVNNALFQSPFYAQYSQTILHPPPVPGSTVATGNKDLTLFREAVADASLHLPLADYLARQFHQAEEAGLKDQDWAVGQYRVAQATALG